MEPNSGIDKYHSHESGIEPALAANLFFNSSWNMFLFVPIIGVIIYSSPILVI